ncbi:MAG: primosomal protein N' [Phycisphaerae bacterium]
MTDRTKNLFAPEPDERTSPNTVRLAFESGVDREFDYLVPNELWPVQPGQRIEAPFGKNNKPQVGFCVETKPAQEKTDRQFKLKIISKVIDPSPLIDAHLMELARWISSYYICPLGQVLAAMVPSAVKKQAGLKKEKTVYLACEQPEKPPRSKKQKELIELLKSKGAVDADSAVTIKDLTQAAACTQAPVKKLAQNGFIRISQRQIFTALPAIPASMILKTKKVILNDDQKKALAHFQDKIEQGGFGVTLLFGVTDSGKTELYIRSIQHVIQKGKKAIVLLPEIALTAQTVQRFSDRFEKIAVLHSGLTAAQRNVQWQKICANQADVVIGARSAIFAPVDNLGLVIVDEEHEPSFKQDTVPRYHGRDVAVKRAQLCSAHCILASATPSLETLHNCRTKSFYHIVRLPKRVLDLPKPKMQLVDLRQIPQSSPGLNLISDSLCKALQQAIEKKEQAILLLNRRGYSNFVFCPSCKHMLHCRNCDVTLTFHRASLKPQKNKTITGRHMNYGYALCHYCLSQTLVPEKCPLCGKGMAMIGFGTQRLEEELNNKFPNAKIKRVDSDSMTGRDYYSILRDFSSGKIDILAGTQMLAKGLHFPNVTVVGIISAETSLYLPDFRANERTFQLISQVAGRTGRSEKKGIVYVQTFLPDQPAIQFAMKDDFEGFVKEELKHRKNCNLPPLWRMANIVLRDSSYEKLETAAAKMRQIIDFIISDSNLNAVVRGPIPPVISRIQQQHRLHIVVQAPDALTIQNLFERLRQQKPIQPRVTIIVDIDPINLM